MKSEPKLKKLYRGPKIAVDPQITRWQLKRKHLMQKPIPFKTRVNALKKAEKDLYSRVALEDKEKPQEEAFKSILDLNLFTEE